MSTVPLAPPVIMPVAPKQATGFVGFLKHFGSDAKKVLGWLASPKNQNIIRTGVIVGESVINSAEPALAGLAPIVNGWMEEIFKAEALGQAAGAGADTNTQKAAAVLSSVTPQVIAFATANKLSIPTGDKLQAANDALVAFLNALGGPVA